MKLNKAKLLNELKTHLDESKQILENSDNAQEIGVCNCLELYINLIESGDFDEVE